VIRSKQLTAACLLALCACNPQAPKSVATPSHGPASPAGAPALHVSGQGTAAQPVRVIQQIHNRIKYELIASSYESNGRPGKTRAVFQNARVTFHDRNGATMTATAPQAIVDETTNVVTMIGGVRARTGPGMALQCVRLDYDRASEMLHGTGNVVIVDPNGFRGTGSSFDSDISLTHMQMR
jgi:hypothetical protein